VAEVPRKPYNQGRKDGRSGTIPIDPWSPPASEWTQAERDAYVAGFSAGRKSRSARGGSRRRRSSADAPKAGEKKSGPQGRATLSSWRPSQAQL